MPVISDQVTKIYKMLPLILQADGSAEITIREGIMEAGEFRAIAQTIVSISPENAATILDAPPQPNLTRRKDLSNAVYQYLLDRGVISGSIA